MWQVYVLQSLRFEKTYVGMTQHLERRLEQHNGGRSKFTSAYIPWKVIYVERYASSVEARAREKYLKSAAGKRYITNALGRAGSLPDLVRRGFRP